VLFWILTAGVAGAQTIADDVARGWYLWETGRDAEVSDLARQLVEEHPDAVPALELYAAMQVYEGRGASIEAELRERYGRDPSNAASRVALAYAIVYRHAEPGPWCDEVDAMVTSVVDGDAHAWATLAEREAELRCEGSTDHADAELGRLSRDTDSPVWVDGVLARADDGYIRSELAEAIEEVWAAAPERLDAAPRLWDSNTTGPSRGKARRVTKRALSHTSDSARPYWVWPTVKAYRQLGWEDDAAKAARRLERLDGEAQLDLGRDRHAISDPPEYAAIDACFDSDSQSAIRECSAELRDPGKGAISAHLHYRRFLAHRAFGEPEEALTEAIAAWHADPDLTSYARIVVAASLDVEELSPSEDAATAKAVDDLLSDVPDIERASSPLARRWARDLLLGARASERAGDVSRAADLYLRSFALSPSPARRLELGRALADSKQKAAAVLHLTQGLIEAMDQPELVADARERLDALAPDWGRRDANQVLQHAIGGSGPESPLLGEVLVPTGFEWPADGAEVPTVRLVVLWGHLFQDPEARYAELETIASFAAANDDVSAIAADIGVRRQPFPEDIDMVHVSAGPLNAQSLQIVTVPTVLVLDRERRLMAVLSPFTNDEAADEALVEAVDAVRADAD